MPNEPKKTAILLINLGTPAAPTQGAVKAYLKEFLSDKRVVQIPRFIWLPILYGFVLRKRPAQSAKLYEKIWMEEGSPLLVNSQRLSQELQKSLNRQLQQPENEIMVILGMRYGQPSISQALAEIKKLNYKKLIVLPLFPQYSATTTASAFDAVNQILSTWNQLPEIQFIPHYFDQIAYQKAWSEQIQLFCEQQQINFAADNHLLFSFHGLPQKFIQWGDPYQSQCIATAETIVNQLDLKPEQWSVAFQSRFGRSKWLEPYCDKTLANMPARGIKNVTVVCPGFAVDCLETLEEINIQNRAIFLNAGGKNFSYIPALNFSELHVGSITKILLDHM